MYLNGLKSGVYPTDFWKEFARQPVPNFEIPFSQFSMIAIEELIRFRNKAVSKYYFRPFKIIKEIKKLGSYKEFRRKYEMCVSLMKNILN